MESQEEKENNCLAKAAEIQFRYAPSKEKGMMIVMMMKKKRENKKNKNKKKAGLN